MGTTGPYGGRGPRGYQRSDERTREDVCERLERHPQIDATDIECSVSGGVVTLEGTVDNRQVKRLAEDVVEMGSGVKEAQNQIRVQSPGQSSWPEQQGKLGPQGQSGQQGLLGQGQQTGAPPTRTSQESFEPESKGPGKDRSKTTTSGL